MKCIVRKTLHEHTSAIDRPRQWFNILSAAAVDLKLKIFHRYLLEKYTHWTIQPLNALALPGYSTPQVCRCPFVLWLLLHIEILFFFLRVLAIPQLSELYSQYKFFFFSREFFFSPVILSNHLIHLTIYFRLHRFPIHVRPCRHTLYGFICRHSPSMLFEYRFVCRPSIP